MTATIQNLTRPAQPFSFQLGDQWRITISGAPAGALISADSVWTHAGKADAGTANFGNADAAGNFKLEGTMQPAEAVIGSWVEVWKANGQTAGTFHFDVTAPAIPTPPPSSSNTTPPPPSSSNTPPPPPSSSAHVDNPLASVWNGALAIAPAWVWIGAAAGVLIMRGRR